MKSKSLCACLLVLAFVQGCASRETKKTESDGPDPTITPAMLDQSYKQSVACVYREISQLDDKVSPANVIGEQVASICRQDLDKYFYMTARSMTTNPINIRAYMEGVGGYEGLATLTVLRRRANELKKQ